MEKQIDRKHNYNLDLVKIFACIAVVGLHTLQKDISLLNALLYYACGFAVPAFFMSTGYILLNRFDINKKYSVKKIKNILKIVLIWSLLLFCAKILFVAILTKKNEIQILEFLKIAVGSVVQRGKLWQFWYLGALILVYMILPILLKNRENILKIWLVLVVISVCVQIVSYIIGQPLQSYCIQTFRIWTWLQYFILGGLIGKYKKEEFELKKMNFKKHTIIFFAFTILVVVYQNYIGKFVLHNSYAEYFYGSIITVTWLIILFTWIMNLTLSQKIINIIKYIVPVTMGVYIVHPLIISIIMRVILINTILKSFLFFVFIVFISFVIVRIMYKIPILKELIKL